MFKIWLLPFAAGSMIALLFAHGIVIRILFRSGRSYSPQKLVASLILIFNAPIQLAWAALCLLWLQLEASDRVMSGFYLLVFYNAAGYAYFHLFNLSETGRRIRMILKLYPDRTMPVEALQGDYSIDNMIEARIKRLVEMGQIADDADGRFRIINRFLLRAALLLQFLSMVLMGRARPGA